ncbi:MAG: NifB/NifX family molybdenum-iron cluster-binding protein [Maledivibacter sp.]|jgi:predicted Fe-Mo cluster-binding NifX family protein|nr:NifB/NifX family molybdenum-iron cluster-binding protein [Maledivibacter sp.]
MKIAIAKDGNVVSGHFGHCEGFEIAQIEDGNVLNREFLPNPGHKPGFLPKYLAERHVNVIVSGGMGATAQELFARNNINVIVGAKGNLDDVINEYVNGKLKSTNSVCREHQHEGHCND